MDELYWISGGHGVLSTSDGNKDCIRPIAFLQSRLVSNELQSEVGIYVNCMEKALFSYINLN